MGASPTLPHDRWPSPSFRFGGLGQGQRGVDIDAQIPNGVLDLTVPEQDLDCPQNQVSLKPLLPGSVPVLSHGTDLFAASLPADAQARFQYLSDQKPQHAADIYRWFERSSPRPTGALSHPYGSSARPSRRVSAHHDNLSSKISAASFAISGAIKVPAESNCSQNRSKLTVSRKVTACISAKTWRNCSTALRPPATPPYETKATGLHIQVLKCQSIRCFIEAG